MAGRSLDTGHVAALHDAAAENGTGSPASWAPDRPSDPDSARTLAVATEHRDGWLRGHRGVRGFVRRVLRPR
ncbi:MULTISPECIES: hypothetical protein [Streptomyces]|uniref:hypothetical protein n=1 Tax=Streptomyces TaxID=1883 RepID=UPI001EFB7D18|nr:hypothetical protein [Streptomyces sp. CL12-4]MCG8968123.1 hypothetical protein [Streptomyces sp. CL12-4]